MGLFEFLMILISVIVGLAVTEVLTGAANLLRERASVKFYWLHTLMQVGVFFALLQQWWESWDLVNVTEISFGNVLLLLLPSVLLFLIAHLLYPRSAIDADLEEHYYEQTSLLWGLALLGTVLGDIISPLLRGNVLFEDPSNWLGIPVMVCLFALVVSQNRKLHSLIVPITLILVVLDIWLVTPELSSD